MPSKKHKDFRNFYLKDVPQETFCSECHCAVKYVVPAENITYLVHNDGCVCVIDNHLGAKR